MNVAISTTISIGISTRQNSVSNYPGWAVFCGTSRWHILQLGRPLPGWRQYQLFSKYEPLKPFYIFPTDAMLGCFPQTTALSSSSGRLVLLADIEMGCWISLRFCRRPVDIKLTRWPPVPHLRPGCVWSPVPWQVTAIIREMALVRLCANCHPQVPWLWPRVYTTSTALFIKIRHAKYNICFLRNA